LAFVFFAEAFIVDFFFAIFSTSPESGMTLASAAILEIVNAR